MMLLMGVYESLSAPLICALNFLFLHRAFDSYMLAPQWHVLPRGWDSERIGKIRPMGKQGDLGLSEGDL